MAKTWTGELLDTLLVVGSSVRLSVVCEICQVIRYVAAPGGERGGGLSCRIRYTLISVSCMNAKSSLNYR